MPKRELVLSQKSLEIFSVSLVPSKKGIAPVCQVVVPVPPLAVAKEPVQPGIKVRVLAVVVEMLIWMLVSEEVATWIAEPVKAEIEVKAEVR